MKQVIEVELKCRKCGNENIVKNGHNATRKQQYYCKDCQWRGILNPSEKYSNERKEEILRAYQERASMRGIQRTFGVARQTLAAWIKKKVEQLPKFIETIQPCQPEDVIERDELWSFVQKKANQSWLFIALCRRTRQIVGFALGKRNTVTCVLTYRETPLPYFDCPSFSDFFEPYNVFPHNTPCPKQSGQTTYVEGWNNTLRQRFGRFVRKTLSFSKSPLWHELVTRWFIVEYNLSLNN